MNNPITARNKDHEYLGDGVYASHDGYQIWLDLRGQDTVTAIALDPSVFEALIRYQARIVAEHKVESRQARKRLAVQRSLAMDPPL